MNDFRADLHCHSTCSDGTLTPTEIIQLASQLNLQGLSITDHDTIAAYQEAFPVALTKGLPLISGLELSATHRQTSVHILAYSFPLNSSVIEEFCQRHSERRNLRYQKILELLASHDMPLSLDDLTLPSSTHSLGRPHIASPWLKRDMSKISSKHSEAIWEKENIVMFPVLHLASKRHLK